VITGQHPFEVVEFHELFRAMPDVDAYIQHMEDFAADCGGAAGAYDVLVFYNCHMETPGGETRWFEKNMRPALEALGTREQGIFLLHHAIVAFPDWPLWSDLAGIADRRVEPHMEQTVRVQVAGAKHPITQGVPDWEMTDETYAMDDPGIGCEPLFMVDHPKSMKTIGWTRRFKKSRVFCFQPGHDSRAFSHPQFRTAVHRGIQWLASHE
jgi:uncharacterized protein